jgi:hypothetical protein
MWKKAAAADGLADGEFDRCAMIIADTPPVLLNAGRTGRAGPPRGPT